jgi:hypothetical protein
VSIATATFQLVFVAAIFLLSIAALLAQAAFRLLHGATSDGAIVVSVPSGAPAAQDAVTGLVRRHAPKARLESVAQSGRETVLSYGVSRLDEASALALPAAVRTEVEGATCQIFFARPHAL